jgi:hypothetical protein
MMIGMNWISSEVKQTDSRRFSLLRSLEVPELNQGTQS